MVGFLSYSQPQPCYLTSGGVFYTVESAPSLPSKGQLGPWDGWMDESTYGEAKRPTKPR
jgi:hypothetical protein